MHRSLAADLLLLMLDDERGTPLVDATRRDAGLAAAAVLDLTLDGVLTTDPADADARPSRQRLRATGRPATDDLHAEIAAFCDGRRTVAAVTGVAGHGQWRNRSRQLREALLDDLVATGALRTETTSLLGLTRTRWVSADPARERQVLASVEQVVDGAEPDERIAALVSVLHATGLLPTVLPGYDRRALTQRGTEIAEGSWASSGVRAAVDAVNTAVMVAFAASMAASSGT